MDDLDVIARIHAIDPATEDVLDALVAARSSAQTHADTVAVLREATRRRLRPRSSARRSVLLAAASVIPIVLIAAGVVAVQVGKQPHHVGGASATTLNLTGDERVYTAMLGDRGPWTGTGSPSAYYKRYFINETWTSADGSYLVRYLSSATPFSVSLTGATPPPTDPQAKFEFDEDRLIAAVESDGVRRVASPGESRDGHNTEIVQSAAELESIPVTGQGFAAYIHAKALAVVNGVPDRLNVATVEPSATVSLLIAPLASPALREAAFAHLEDLPGVTNHGEATDSLGRRGTELSFVDRYSDLPDNSVRLIFDPATASVLEHRTASTTSTGAATNNAATYLGPTIVGKERDRPEGVVLPGTTDSAPYQFKPPSIAATAP